MGLISRYNGRNIFLNEDNFYKELFSDRNINRIKQYVTPSFKQPSIRQITQLTRVSHIWKLGDRYYKLAYKYYHKRSNLWWIIAWYNQLPVETLLQPGDIVYIPLPIEKVMSMFHS